MMKSIILASTSPRRKELLSKIVARFEVIEGSYEEDNSLDMEPAKLAMYHAKGKAESVFKNHSDAIVIGADNFVVSNEHVLFKPKDKEDARELLEKQSGKTTTVITGVCILSKEHTSLFTESTTLKMKEMTAEEIEKYLLTEEYVGRAGAFSVEGKGSVFIEHIEGEFFNVAGLPVYRVAKELQNFGVKLFDF